jgi:hypothetical protein
MNGAQNAYADLNAGILTPNADREFARKENLVGIKYEFAHPTEHAPGPPANGGMQAIRISYSA